MNILFIGNSYTYYNDMPAIFQTLCRDNGLDVTATAVTKGGRKLLSYKDPNDATTVKLTEALKQHYDVCMLQEQSILPITDFDSFMEGLQFVKDMVGNQADRFILYATWGRKPGSATLLEHGWDTESMTEMLAESYKKAADHFGAEISPVGELFLAVSQQLPELELYNPDMTHPSYAGSALSALTHYYTIFKAFPVNTGSLDLESAVIDTYRKVICK
ncbi:MAG: hypothetical protein IKA47_12285 [Oscillospiraceae bacterium]|nr:hypothetical protein [Oscillospiraceae bacterium]